jgi:D-arabinose 1-dehydrogenase-like Zn-dependent alcohol dehydrogenase
MMTPKIARANLLDRPDGHFVIGEYPVPDPAPGTVLTKIELCGICGTDVHTGMRLQKQSSDSNTP